MKRAIEILEGYKKELEDIKKYYKQSQGDLETIADIDQALQLLQTGVSGRSGQLCSNLNENYNCKNMCLTHCVDGNKFYK